MTSKFDLSGRRILITGAGKGLGAAFALAMADAGAEIAAFDIDAAALAGLKQRLPALHTAVVDVADRHAFLAAAAGFGRLDSVVNNAMLIRYDPIEAVDDTLIDRMLAIGIKGSIWGTQALLAQRDPDQPAVILNLASPTGERGFAGTAVYSAVKAAIGSLTRTLAAELGPRGIRVNALAPASIPTPGATAITPREEYERRSVRFPLRRIGHEDDATAAAMFLLSDAASFISGEILHVDGGFSASA